MSLIPYITINFRIVIPNIIRKIMVQRIFDLSDLIKKEKVLIIYGPRRVGKTTLLKEYLKTTGMKYKWETGDDIAVQQLLGSQKLKEILSHYEGYDLVAIDEAQYIPNIGMGLKLLVDNKPGISIVITGSSSFNIEQQTGEPLTGRKRTITLYPFAMQELLTRMNQSELHEQLESLLIFGLYPEVFLSKTKQDKIEVLTELVNSYLLKDVFSLSAVRGTKQFIDLLKLLAFQVGSEVSHHELATQLEIDIKTVKKYLEILERAFVIKRFTPYNKNLRKEITKKCKYYFLDNGIMNGVISQFNMLQDRNDVGRLFENFFMMERTKYISNNRFYRNSYFWRTYSGQEIDLVEEYDGKLFPYEIKWSEKGKLANIQTWYSNYHSEAIQQVNRENYLNFLLKKMQP